MKQSSEPGLESTVVSTESDPGPCVATDDLADMVDGRLAADRIDAVLVHVDRCPVCAEVMSNVASLGSGGRTLGRYQLRGELGAGAMGVVHDAWDPRLRRRVAIKLVRPERADAGAHARMLREAQALARISHPNVVAVHDAGDHDGEIYVATELIDGETIATWQRGKPARAIVEAWIQVARGLAAAHAEGVVHRDVKPANVLVGRDGRVRIGDFGLARVSGGRAATDPAGSSSAAPPEGDLSAIAGTPAYMAPEQLAGQFDARSDQFAFCVALAEALTGERPSAGEAVAVEPPRLAEALRRGLRAVPAERFPAMSALADELAAAITPPRRVPWRAIAVATVGVAGAAGVAVWAALGSAPRPSCEVATVPAALWSPARKAALERAFAPNVAARVEGWLATWSAASADLCATGELSTVQDHRWQCLQDELVELQQVIATWEAHRAAPYARVRTSTEDLPRLARCSHGVVSATRPPTPAQRALIATLRPWAHDARWDPQPRAVLRKLRALADAARAIGHTPFTVEVMLALSAVLLDRSDPPGARGLLREAIALADASHDELSRVIAIASLLPQLAPRDLDEAVRLDDTSRAVLVRLGGDPVLERRIDVGLGVLLGANQRVDEAIAAFERAHRSFRAAREPDSWDEANMLIGLGGAYTNREPASAIGKQLINDGLAMFTRLGLPLTDSVTPTDPDEVIEKTRQVLVAGRVFGPNPSMEFSALANFGDAYNLKDDREEALANYRRAAEIGETLGDRERTRLSDVYDKAARMLLRLGRPGDALPAARRAYAIAMETGVERSLAESLTTLGHALVEQRDPTAGEVLERAQHLRDRLKDTGAPLGRTRFQLARALVDRDRRRALGLAAAARADLEGELRELPAADPLTPYLRRIYQARIDEIDHWTDARR